MLQLDAEGSDKVVLDIVQHIDKSLLSLFVATFPGVVVRGFQQFPLKALPCCQKGTRP
jgi:hypothetical protein